MVTNRLGVRLAGFVFVLLLAAGCASSPSATSTLPEAATSAPALAATSAPTQAAQSTAVSTAANTTASPIPVSGGELTFTVVPDKSEARYRVREQLASLSFPSDAIGKTRQISGAISVKPDGSIDTANSKIVVDLSTLQSDQNMRDNFLRRSVLQTSQYPNATFVPTSISGLPSPLPQSGPVSFKVTGDLTVRDVTKPVTWDVTGTIQGNQASGTATTSFTFEDFNLTQPRVPVVLSVVNHIALEVDITLQQSGS